MTSILWDAKDSIMAMPTTDKTMPITSEKSDTKPKRKTKAKIAPFTLNQATLEQLAKNRAYDGTTARKALDGQGINCLLYTSQ